MGRRALLDTKLIGPQDTIQTCMSIIEGNLKGMLESPFWLSANRPKGLALAELAARIVTDIEILMMRQSEIE